MIDEETIARWRREDERFDRLDRTLTEARVFMLGVIFGMVLMAVMLL